MWAIEFTGKGLIREHMSVPFEGSLAAIAFNAGRSVRFGRAELEHLSAPTVKLLLEEGIYSMCCMPLTVHDRRLGTLGLARSATSRSAPTTRTCSRRWRTGSPSRSRTSSPSGRSRRSRTSSPRRRSASRRKLRTEHNFEDIIGRSDALKRVLHQVETVAPTGLVP